MWAGPAVGSAAVEQARGDRRICTIRRDSAGRTASRRRAPESWWLMAPKVFDAEAVEQIARKLEIAGFYVDEEAGRCPATVDAGALSGEVMLLMAELAEAAGELADRLRAIGDTLHVVARRGGEVENSNVHTLAYLAGGVRQPEATSPPPFLRQTGGQPRHLPAPTPSPSPAPSPSPPRAAGPPPSPGRKIRRRVERSSLCGQLPGVRPSSSCHRQGVRARSRSGGVSYPTWTR